MALSTREVLLLVRAKEDAQRALSGISRTLRSTGAAADAASARARAAALRAQAQQMKLTGATQAQIAAVREAARAWDRHAASVEQSRRRTQAFMDSLRGSGEAMTAVGLGLGAVGVGGALVAKSWIDTAVAYERQVRHTRTQVDGLRYTFEQLRDVGIRTARDLPIVFEQVQPALFDIFSSMEVNLQEAELLLRQFSKGAIAGQTDIQAVSRATIGILNAFKLPASDVTRILDLQFELVQEGIGTYEEWNQRIGLVTPSAVRAGQSIEIMIAALASSTRMGISAARSGTAVARAFDAMSNPKVVRKLEKLGVDIVDAQGKFKPFNEVLRDFREILLKLPEKDRVKMILDVFQGAGSTIEARRFLQNMLLGAGNLEIFDNILKETANSSGNMERAYREMAGSTAAQSERLRNSWMIVKEALGRALMPAFNELLDALRRALEWFNRLPPGVQEVIGKIVGFGSVLTIAAGALVFIVGSIAIFVSAISGIAGPLVIATGVLIGLAAAGAGIGVAFFNAYRDSREFRDLVAGIGKKFGEARDIIVEATDQIVAVWNSHLKPAFDAVEDVLYQEVIPAVNAFSDQVWNSLRPKLEEAARILEDNFANSLGVIAYTLQEVVIPSVRLLTEWYKKNKDAIDPIIFLVGMLAKLLITVLAVAITATALGWLTLASGMSASILVFTSVISWTRQVIKWLGDLWGWLKRLVTGSNEFKAAIATSMSAAGRIILNFRSAVLGVFGNAGSWLFKAGQNIIAGLIRGVQSMIGVLRGTFGAVTQMIPNVKGPEERDRRLLRPAGRHIMTGLIVGIQGELPRLRRTLNDVTNTVDARGIDFSGAAALARVGSATPQTSVFNNGGNRTFTVNNTIYAADKDVRTLGAELGWEIANRVG